MIIQEKLASSPFLAGASLPLEQVTSKRFRAGQIISDKPSGVSSVGMIVSGRVEVYSVALAMIAPNFQIRPFPMRTVVCRPLPPDVPCVARGGARSGRSPGR